MVDVSITLSEPFLMTPIVVIRNATRLEEALETYFMQESLDFSFRCGACHEVVPCVKRNQIEEPPLVLIIGPKRFNTSGKKDDRVIAMPKKLNLTDLIR